MNSSKLRSRKDFPMTQNSDAIKRKFGKFDPKYLKIKTSI